MNRLLKHTAPNLKLETWNLENETGNRQPATWNLKPEMLRYLIYVLLLLTTASCVPNRKVQFLQKNDVNVSSVPLDTVVRRYKPDQFDYKVQPNDILSIRFNSMTPEKFDFLSGASGAGAQNNIGINNPMMMGELVDEQGEVPFPVLGKVKVAGLTVFQIQDSLQKLANQYLEAPVVKVRLLNYRITVLGEVNQEGTVLLSDNRVTMLEAIGLAGGLNDLADRSQVKLIRQRGDITEVQYINLLDEQFIHSPYYYVNQSDILIVPPLKQRPFRKYFGPNLALVFSSLSLVLFALNLSK